MLPAIAIGRAISFQRACVWVYTFYVPAWMQTCMRVQTVPILTHTLCPYTATRKTIHVYIHTLIHLPLSIYLYVYVLCECACACECHPAAAAAVHDCWGTYKRKYTARPLDDFPPKGVTASHVNVRLRQIARADTQRFCFDYDLDRPTPRHPAAAKWQRRCGHLAAAVASARPSSCYERAQISLCASTWGALPQPPKYSNFNTTSYTGNAERGCCKLLLVRPPWSGLRQDSRLARPARPQARTTITVLRPIRCHHSGLVPGPARSAPTSHDKPRRAATSPDHNERQQAPCSARADVN